MHTKQFLLAASIALTTALTGVAHATDKASPASDAPVQTAQEMKGNTDVAGKKMASKHHHKAHKKVSKKKHAEKHIS